MEDSQYFLHVTTKSRYDKKVWVDKKISQTELDKDNSKKYEIEIPYNSEVYIQKLGKNYHLSNLYYLIF